VRSRGEAPGAAIELGSRAERRALGVITRPPPSTRIETDRLRDPLEEAAWLAGGGCGLVVTWSWRWPARFPRSGTVIFVDLRPHEITLNDDAAIPLTAGPHLLMMPNGRTYPGRCVAELIVEPGVIASVEYRFRFPDGYFRPDTLRTRGPRTS
jgi:hypothetical protein